MLCITFSGFIYSWSGASPNTSFSTDACISHVHVGSVRMNNFSRPRSGSRLSLTGMYTLCRQSCSAVLEEDSQSLLGERSQQDLRVELCSSILAAIEFEVNSVMSLGVQNA